jgi:hypothetical protein
MVTTETEVTTNSVSPSAVSTGIKDGMQNESLDEISESTQAAWGRGLELKAKLAALIQVEAVGVCQFDAKQGGSTEMATYDDSSNGCTMIALMLFALFNFGIYSRRNFTNVISFWSGPVLKAIRASPGDYVEPEPALKELKRRGLMPHEVMTFYYAFLISFTYSNIATI